MEKMYEQYYQLMSKNIYKKNMQYALAHLLLYTLITI